MIDWMSLSIRPNKYLMHKTKNKKPTNLETKPNPTCKSF